MPDAFPADAQAQAEAAAQTPLPTLRDETAVPFVTLDPPGSMDLDQAMCLERRLAPDGSRIGYRVRYAIAAVPLFVTPDSPLDVETRRRGVTIYCPDQRTPLHPQVLSEAAASLLPDQARPAYVWDLELDGIGELVQTTLYPALVRSVARLDYDGVQRAVDDGTADEKLLLLKEIGELRIGLEHKRGGASLPMPEQEVVESSPGHYELRFRPPVASEDWNAQISLLTGMAAAQLMLDAKVGVLRTMPAPDQTTMDRFRRQVGALGVTWPPDMAYGDFLRTLDRDDPRQLAIIHEATSLFRGAGYTAFDGEPPEQRTHAAVAAPYAHVTAPLRRLVDRFGLAIAEALAAGRPVPEWVRSGIGVLPEIMAATGRTASGVERACTDAVEAAVLSQYVGDTFDAVVVDQGQKGAWLLQLTDPAVVAHAGTEVKVAVGDLVAARLTEADVTAGVVRFHITARKGAVPAPAGVPASPEDPLAPPA